MTRTPTPAEIETLRKIVAGRTCTEHDQRAAVAILDRLSPPEPEVDEATKVSREFLARFFGIGDSSSVTIADEYRAGECDTDTDFQAARSVIAELIASKDGEIAWRRVECQRANVMEADIRALRAEKCKWKDAAETLAYTIEEKRKTSRDEHERLRGLLRWAHDTLYEINPSNYDHDEVCKLNDKSVEVILGIAPEIGETHGKSPEWWASRKAAERAEKAESELAALRAENERLKELDHEYGQVEVAIIMSDPEFDGDSDHATCSERLIASVKRLARKAAERNTAEPAIDGQTSVFPPINKLSDDVKASVDRMAARMGGKFVENERWPEMAAAIDTAPVVEVTVDSGMDAEAVEQAELLWAQLPVNRKWISIPTHEKALVCHLLSTYRTEAEARGRREALEEARKNIRDRLYPKNPESDWTPYARDRAAAANSADDELRYLLNGGRRP